MHPRRLTARPVATDEAADVALLARVAGGDRTAVGDLYDRHGRLLFGLALRVLRDRAAAEALLQDVFLRVWRQSEAYTAAAGSPAGWLVAITRRNALERLRSSGGCNPIMAKPNEPWPSPHADAFAALLPVQRTLIEHAFFHGSTLTELSQQFGVPIEQVRTQLHAGLIALRRSLALTSAAH